MISKHLRMGNLDKNSNNFIVVEIKLVSNINCHLASGIYYVTLFLHFQFCELVWQ